VIYSEKIYVKAADYGGGGMVYYGPSEHVSKKGHTPRVVIVKEIEHGSGRPRQLTNVYQVLPSEDGNVGWFKCGIGVSTRVRNRSITDKSVIVLFPTNAAAAKLQASQSPLYISGKIAGDNFTVSTADGSATTGTETFNYIVFN
jgi:hypothetical protein